MTCSKKMLNNYETAIANGAFVSTDSIALLSCIKYENFQKASSHFASTDTLITTLAQLSIKLQATKHFFHLQGFYTKGKMEKRTSLKSLTKDKNFHNVLVMFLGEKYNYQDILALNSIVEASVFNAYSEFI